MRMANLPTGTVTFLFTDIEGSTRLLERLGERYAEALAVHRRLVREAVGAVGGREVDTQGDAFFVAFDRAVHGVQAAANAQRALAEYAWPDGAALRVRMGLHTGEPTVGDEGYLGLDVVRAARICSAGHGGQILISETTRSLIGNDLPEGASVLDLGEAKLKDIQHERLFQLSLDGDQHSFPPLKTEVETSTEDLLGERIQAHVERRLEQAFTGDVATNPMKAAAGGCAIAVAVLVVALLALLALILLVKLAF
jgi:class 3 adenylate cyclase